MQPITHQQTWAPLVEVRTRLDDQRRADELAATTLTQQLAACAHVRGPLASTYRWAGTIKTAVEFELDAVTTPEHLEALVELIESMHPYELPAILVTEVRASPDYANWVANQTAQ